MELNDQQKDTVRSWVAGGAGLSEVQKRLDEELGITMTYMDVRFLVDDLNVSLRDAPTPKPAPSSPSAPADGTAPPEWNLTGADDTASAPGGVRVEVDRIQKPGAIVSGSVIFSDGATATWALDQLGRLALQPAQPTYRPSPEDVREFQEALSLELQRRGF